MPAISPTPRAWAARLPGNGLVRARVREHHQLSHQALEFRARRGQSRFSFVVHWIDRGC
jgi:hypothetical protein